MENSVLDNIKVFAVRELKKEYGFCGLLDNENMVIINASDDEGNDLIIKITSKPEQSEFEQQTEGGHTDDDGGNLPNS